MSPNTVSTVSISISAPVEKDEPSTLRRLAEIIAKISEIFSQMSQQATLEAPKLEHTYMTLSTESADATKWRGTIAVAGAAANLLLFGASFGFPNANDAKFMQEISGKVPDMFKMFDFGREGVIKGKDATAGLTMQRLQTRNSDRQGDKTALDPLIAALNAQIQLLDAATKQLS